MDNYTKREQMYDCPNCGSSLMIAGGLMLADGSLNTGYGRCSNCGFYFDVYGGDIIDPDDMIDQNWISIRDFESGSKFE